MKDNYANLGIKSPCKKKFVINSIKFIINDMYQCNEGPYDHVKIWLKPLEMDHTSDISAVILYAVFWQFTNIVYSLPVKNHE